MGIIIENKGIIMGTVHKKWHYAQVVLGIKLC